MLEHQCCRLPLYTHTGVSSEAGDVEVVDSSELLPGDVFEITSEGLMLSCDAVLLVGGVVVNESMLTGQHSRTTYILITILSSLLFDFCLCI